MHVENKTNYKDINSFLQQGAEKNNLAWLHVVKETRHIVHEKAHSIMKLAK